MEVELTELYVIKLFESVHKQRVIKVETKDKS